MKLSQNNVIIRRNMLLFGGILLSVFSVPLYLSTKKRHYCTSKLSQKLNYINSQPISMTTTFRRYFFIRKTLCVCVWYLLLYYLGSFLSLDYFQHSVSQGCAWVAVTCWIIWSLTYVDRLDDTVIDVKSETLASANDTNGWRSRMVHFHVQGRSELTGWVTHHGHEGIFDTLVFSPSLHDSRIIDAVNNYFVDTSFLECAFKLKIAWYLG